MSLPDTIRVLLVEDDSDDYRLLAKSLRSQCRTVHIDWADTFASACDKLRTFRHDVVLTDLTLPDSSGLATASRLHAVAGNLPIIVLTSLDDKCLERDILGAGAQDYWVKGELNGQAMLRAISHAIHRQQMQNELQQLLAERVRNQSMLQEQAGMLQKKNERLKQLYQTSQEIVDNVSHDFRTPLTVIKDYVSLIREGMIGEINDDQKTLLDKVSARADDLNHMVDDLLDASKLESGLLGAWRRSVSAPEMIERAGTVLRQRARVRRVDLSIRCDPAMPQVYCDSDLAGRVITNLAVNAIKFCGLGGRVELWAEPDPDGKQVVVGVTDNGPGIDEDSLRDIFKRFNQVGTRCSVKGFGLGLSIAQQLTRINLGEMNIQSKVGEGSTFTFTIPYNQPVEVLKRWLQQQSSSDALRIKELTTSAQATEASADELDWFLACLLRKNDLLFRVTPRRWLLALAAPHSELDAWRKRADAEFEKHNRNRPAGPLPEFQVATHGQWSLMTERLEVLEKFGEVLRRAVAQGVTTTA